MPSMRTARSFGLAMFVLTAGVASADPKISGGIEISSRGCRAVVVQSEEAPWKEQNLNVFYEKVIQTKLGVELARKGEISSLAAIQTAEEVEKLFKILTKEYGLDPKDIYVCAGSSLADAEGLDRLKTAVKEKIDKEVDVLSAASEIFLAMKGLMPEKYMENATYIDAGSNTVKYGVAVSGGKNALPQFRSETSPGTVMLATKIRTKREKAEGKSFADIAAEEGKLYVSELRNAVDANAGMANRTDVLVSGGIVWAMVTITKPEFARATHVRLTADDIKKFNAMLRKDEKKFPEVDTTKIAWQVLKDEADAEIGRVRDIFTMEQLIAGGEILQAMSTALAFENKKIYFTRQGSNSWIAAYAVEKSKQAAPAK